MSISNSISRFTAYYTRHGFRATIRRAGVALKRGLLASRMVLFYCDLGKQTTAPVNIPSSLKAERLRSHAELSPQDLQEMTSFWNPKQAHKNIRERFEQGASLWLIKSGDKLAGYGWTLQGRTIEPHYFPLAQDDVHLFDFYVFPEYRGRGINPFLVNHILRSLGSKCAGRAFIEAAEWNEAQLSSLRKTAFRPVGWARKSAIFHRTLVCWAQKDAVEGVQKVAQRSERASNIVRSQGR
ncbi:MAG: GNAT family N-acetyltransferase [Candidatus Acidiferrum sp.]